MLGLLRGVRVVDLTRLYTLATTKLADLGADVIKIEEPPAGDPMRTLPPLAGPDNVSLTYLMLNRNKRNLALDLRSPDGMAVFDRLVASADVVVENARPGANGRRGLGYERLRTINAQLIYCSVSGYGQTGPYRDLPSHGLNLDASAGHVRTRPGPDGRPELDPFGSGTAVDLGALHAALGIAAALVQRALHGTGQYLDVSCWDAAVSHNRAVPTTMNLGGTDNDEPLWKGPRYDIYQTKDDRLVFLCPIEKKFWERFCTAVGRPDWSGRGRWDGPMDFGRDDPALGDDLAELISSRTLDDWMGLFLAEGIPASPVHRPGDLPDTAHFAARRMKAESPAAPDQSHLRIPIAVPGDEFSVRPAPVMGADTDAVLTELGYDQTDIDRLRENGAAPGPNSPSHQSGGAP